MEGEAKRETDARRPSAWPSSTAAEEFILTVSANGYGKRTSAYEYRRTNRGGQGITNIVTSTRNGPVVASFPAHNGEQLMLVTDQAKLIRMSVGDTRVTGRNTPGVRLFNVAEDEHVVSAARIDEEEEPENEAEALVAEELAEQPAPRPATRWLDDGTGPQTMDERVDEDDGGLTLTRREGLSPCPAEGRRHERLYRQAARAALRSLGARAASL